MEIVIVIENNGPEIVTTNYWATALAKRGAFFLSANAGAFRLLVPEIQFALIAEMLTAKEVVISRGRWAEHGGIKDAFEVLFEDQSEAPFSIQLTREQIDRLPLDSDQGKIFIFSIWTESGKVKAFKCRYRRVLEIPSLRPGGQDWSV